jgi:hypothetical protein
MNQRFRPIFFAVGVMLLVWVLAWAGFTIAGESKVTADKLRAHVEKTDLSKLSGDARAKALRELAAKINALPPDERRQARVERIWAHTFEQMTEAEKAEFLESTLPSGFKQMLAAFEQLPEEKRRRTIENSVRKLRETRDRLAAEDPATPRDTNAPVLSPELQKRVAMTGLKTIYGESSAQTKAELAPLLEEIQRSMETGSAFRRR